MSWNVATWVVTAGTSAASRNPAITRRRKRNRKRSIAYAVIEPMMTVPVIEMARMMAVLVNARSMCPWSKATLKLRKFSQLCGRASGPPLVDSRSVLNAVMKATPSGSRVIAAAATSETYFATVALRAPMLLIPAPPRRPARASVVPRSPAG